MENPMGEIQIRRGSPPSVAGRSPQGKHEKDNQALGAKILMPTRKPYSCKELNLANHLNEFGNRIISKACRKEYRPA